MQQIRTDLALENHEALRSSHQDLNGITLNEIHDLSLPATITHVQIHSKEGAELMHKSIGHYITIECSELISENPEKIESLSNIFFHQLNQLISISCPQPPRKIFFVGLGNRDVTADALGPRVLDHITMGDHEQFTLCGIAPGVMAKTGMETAMILEGIISKSCPDLLIAIDALAARSIHRLHTTIQLTDTGIQPGSGVGNHRHILSKDNLKIPVIAIGIPTVVDAATIALNFFEQLPQSTHSDFSALATDAYHTLSSMYVTGKDIDLIIDQLSQILVSGFEKTFQISNL